MASLYKTKKAYEWEEGELRTGCHGDSCLMGTLASPRRGAQYAPDGSERGEGDGASEVSSGRYGTGPLTLHAPFTQMAFSLGQLTLLLLCQTHTQVMSRHMDYVLCSRFYQNMSLAITLNFSVFQPPVFTHPTFGAVTRPTPYT